MNYLTDLEAAVLARRDNADVAYVRETEKMVLLNVWTPGDDVDRDDSVRNMLLFLLEKRSAS